MDLALVKEKLTEISTYFYQERIQEGMAMFMDVVGMITQIPEFGACINPLFDAEIGRAHV